jgi:prepilin-type N-terminal cleavage/methylation domain-containing protein
MGKSAGFSLTELMLAVGILGILMMVGLPSFTKMMRNYEIRVVAESVANGLQRARAEGVARNSRVQFVLVPATPSWTVDYVTKPVPTDPPLDAWTNIEGGKHASIAGVAADLSSAATTITFNQLGQVIANADNSATLRQVNLSATGGDQNLRVTIGAGGSARVCDPDPNLPSSNVRKCP